MKQKSVSKISTKPVESRAGMIVCTIAALLCLIGLADATYLTVAHLTGETLACAGAANCSEVLASNYSSIAGIPLAAFGILGYFGAFTFVTLSAFGYVRARAIFALIVWIMFAVTIWLLYVQAFLLHAYCRYCLLSAAVVFMLLALLLVAPPAHARKSGQKA